MKLPNPVKVFVDITKLRDYSLNPEHSPTRTRCEWWQSADLKKSFRCAKQ